MRAARPRVRNVALALAVLVSATAHAATVVDPALRFRMIATEHFVIYFHQGEDATAARLADIAEQTWTRLQQPLATVPPRRTHVVLADQSELANGFASPIPYNAIVVTAQWPAGTEFIGDTTDWLRLVFTHEFTHIVHLDRSESWARVVRGILGRSPFAMPNIFLPVWQIEGLATYQESYITGEGRLHAADFQAITSEAARAGRLEPLDRVNGGLTDWPGGLAAYAYGLGFHEYLADRYGVESLGRLAEATARRVPFTSSAAFKRIYGRSLGDLWRDYEGTLTEAGTTTETEGRQLTHDGFVALGPRYIPGTCAGCPREVLYSLRTPHDFPSLNRLRLDGSAPTRVTTRYLGSTTGIGRDTFVFDQQDLFRNSGVYSDLYAIDSRTAATRRLTVESRLTDPDLSPDGKTIAAVRSARGRRELVLLPLEPHSGEPSVLVSEDETQFNAPRWSPDGRLLAVERHRLGERSQIVVVDVATRAIRVVAGDPAARIVTPAWRPDGRAIVAALSEEGVSFNLYEFPLDGSSTGRRLTNTTGGATWPDVSSDGRFIVFVGYTDRGFDLFETAYPPVAEASASRVAATAPPRDRAADAAPGPQRQAVTYRPWSTLVPTSWSPVIDGDRTELRVGAATAATDVLGYHSYALSATWLVSESAAGVEPNRAEPDWQVAYAYDRWRPTWWVTASSTTSFFAGPPSEAGTPSTATLRERQLEGGVLLPFRRVRTSQTVLASLVRAGDTFTLPGRTVERTRVAARAAWTLNSSHTYGYSISREGGALFGVTSELVRRALGASADATTVTADGRAYFALFARHQVLALRLAGGTSTGEPTVGRTFLLGGASPNLSAADFGSSAISLLRGFGANTFGGRHVALLNADYRFPLARPQRGDGTVPLFIQTVHGAVVADAGHAWTNRFQMSDMKTSIGAELSADLIVAYQFPLTLTVGVAYGHDGSGIARDGTTVFVRVGRAF